MPRPETQKAHSSSPVNGVKGPRNTAKTDIQRRVRTRQACESCRRRRRKCNGLFPCSQCKGYSYPCQYVGGPPDESLADQNAGSDDDNIEDQDTDGVRGPTVDHTRTKEEPSRQHHGPQTIIQPENHSQRSGDAGSNEQNSVPRPIVDPVKGRYSNAHSSILLTKRVGDSMNLVDRIRFHSYGWNLNTRLEPTPMVAPAICRHLTYQDLCFYSRVFFKVVDPVYHILNEELFLQQCAQYWTTERERPDDIEAVVSGVVALGSFFCGTASAVESQLVEHAKQMLDIGCAYAPGRLSLNQTAGWILRTLYLRLTTRPHLSWYASCSTIHVAEAMALHVDLRNAEIVGKDDNSQVFECTSSRAHLFECATFLNSIISAEYGRSRVVLQDSTEADLQSTSKFMRLSAILHRLESIQMLDSRLQLLFSLQELPNEPSIFVLLKTDVAIHLFRKHLSLYQENTNLREQKILLSIIQTGLSEVRRTLPSQNPWWNILSTPFQSLLVLLAMDSDESLALVEEAISVLTAVYNFFPTYLSGEVLQTAKALVQGLEQRKLKQARVLSKACGEEIQVPGTSSALTNFGSASELDQGVDYASAVFANWAEGDMSWSWLPTSNFFAQGSEPAIDAFNFA